MTITFALKGEILLELVNDCRHTKKVSQKGIIYSVALNLKMTPHFLLQCDTVRNDI